MLAGKGGNVKDTSRKDVESKWRKSANDEVQQRLHAACVRGRRFYSIPILVSLTCFALETTLWVPVRFLAFGVSCLTPRVLGVPNLTPSLSHQLSSSLSSSPLDLSEDHSPIQDHDQSTLTDPAETLEKHHHHQHSALHSRTTEVYIMTKLLKVSLAMLAVLFIKLLVLLPVLALALFLARHLDISVTAIIKMTVTIMAESTQEFILSIIDMLSQVGC